MPPHALIIHDSHNVEAKLKAQLLGPIAETNPKAASWKKRLIQAASETERAAVKGSDFILSVSENEVKELEQIYSVDRATLRAAPNGVDAQTTRPPEPTERETLRRRLGIAAGQTVAIFIGSAHLPNIEAARFIFDELAPGVPGVLFIIAGEVARTLPQTSKRQNMRLISPLSEELKHELLKIADVGLNPTEAGSGTNLKSVETMAAGHLLLTTPNGARGLPLTHGREAVILPRRMFAPALNTLTSEPEHVQQIRTNGRILAEQEFDWPHTMSPLIELLDQH